MDLKNLKVNEILSMVDSGELDPVITLTNEMSGKNRKSLVTALENRIDVASPNDDLVLSIVEETEDKPLILPVDEPDPVSPQTTEDGEPLAGDDVRFVFASHAPDIVEIRGTKNCTFDRHGSPQHTVSLNYWRGVLSRTGLFIETD